MNARQPAGVDVSIAAHDGGANAHCASRALRDTADAHGSHAMILVTSAAHSGLAGELPHPLPSAARAKTHATQATAMDRRDARTRRSIPASGPLEHRPGGL